jgi:hypothetical protein
MSAVKKLQGLRQIIESTFAPTDVELTRPLEIRQIAKHGTFDYQPAIYARLMREPRKSLLSFVLGMYEGNGDFGEKASHWQGYKKEDLAAIAAYGLPMEDEKGRVIGGGSWKIAMSSFDAPYRAKAHEAAAILANMASISPYRLSQAKIASGTALVLSRLAPVAIQAERDASEAAYAQILLACGKGGMIGDLYAARDYHQMAANATKCADSAV